MSEWVSFVKAYAKKHGIKYGEALKRAAPEYRKRKGKEKKHNKKQRGFDSGYTITSFLALFWYVIPKSKIKESLENGA